MGRGVRGLRGVAAEAVRVDRWLTSLADLADWAGPAAVGAAALFIAYLTGAVVEPIWRWLFGPSGPLYRRSGPPSSFWPAYENLHTASVDLATEITGLRVGARRLKDPGTTTELRVSEPDAR